MTIKDIDCNCNDCFFMKRDFVRFDKSKENHLKWQKSDFESRKLQIQNKIEENKIIGKSFKELEFELKKMRFQFDKSECILNFGYCEKIKKDISFIPNVCQIETQHCFKNRK